MDRDGQDRNKNQGVTKKITTKGIAYYSDLSCDLAILRAVQVQLQRAAPGVPIVAVTLEPAAHGHDMSGYSWPDTSTVTCLTRDEARGVLTMFRQILQALETLDTDVAFLCEHDVLYHPSHFAFTPPTDDLFYYNQNRWQVSAEDGRSVHYLASQTSGCCASRMLLVEHYRKRIAYVEAHGFDRNLGYEPGTNRRSREIDPHGSATWLSAGPNVDIRHGRNLSRSKWSIADFRDKRNAAGWTEADAVPEWGTTRGRFSAFLSEIPGYTVG